MDREEGMMRKIIIFIVGVAAFLVAAVVVVLVAREIRAQCDPYYSDCTYDTYSDPYAQPLYEPPSYDPNWYSDFLKQQEIDALRQDKEQLEQELWRLKALQQGYQ